MSVPSLCRVRVGVLAILAVIAIWLAWAGSARPALAGDAPPRTGVLLLHGKLDHKPGRLLESLGRALAADGRLILAPELPWSARRGYDKTYAAALDEIAEHLAALRGQGATRLILCGHSLGANAALAYAATRGGVDAVILLAPGHTPFLSGQRKLYAPSLEQARRMIQDGRGADTAAFQDANNGEKFSQTMRADVYASYFAPDGLSEMPRLARSVPASIPVLLVRGDTDKAFPQARADLFGNLPANPASAFLEVEAGHKDTPDVAREKIVEWVRGLGL